MQRRGLGIHRGKTRGSGDGRQGTDIGGIRGAVGPKRLKEHAAMISFRRMVPQALEEGIEVRRALLKDMLGEIVECGQILSRALQAGRKILLFGNGGSAADAQHIAAELVGRFTRERRALPAIALTTDTSALTAIGNDYGFDQIFSRQVAALVEPGDVAIGISTSGKSENVIRGLQEAARLQAKTIGWLGRDGGAIKRLVDVAVVVPSNSISRVQEAHITIGHIICEYVDATLSESSR